jgi:hypothetical protein
MEEHGTAAIRRMQMIHGRYRIKWIFLSVFMYGAIYYLMWDVSRNEMKIP